MNVSNILKGLIVLALLAVLAVLYFNSASALEAKRSEEVAACAFQAEQTYPAPNFLEMSMDERGKVIGNRSKLTMSCMKARGYEYTHECSSRDLNVYRHAQIDCLFRIHHQTIDKASDEEWKTCQSVEKGKVSQRRTDKKCYVPSSFLGRAALRVEKFIGRNPVPNMWCYEVLNDFKTSLRMPGYLWTYVAPPLMPGEECEGRVSELTIKESQRLNELIRKEPNPSFEALKE
jgi:hypothetical protein